ncbi:unnamed protein product [Cunninghamella blakesleeana]
MFEEFNGRYIVIGVSCLISFLLITVQWGVLYPILTEWSFIEKLKLLSPINIGAFLLSYNYYLAITTEPGRVPDGWEPPYSLINEPEQVQIKNGETGPRYCRTCEAYKPPRTHHCRVCKRCVLKMDHHCPWINNCVGFGNYPHFFRFVFFVNLTCGYALILLFWRIYIILDTTNIINLNHPLKISEMILLILDFVATFIVVFSVGILGIYHTYCLFRGQTTIEGSERSKVRRLIRRRKISKVDFPYDLGLLKNISSVLGSNPLLWFFPQSAVSGDGLTFSIKPNTDPKLPYYWPPRDPNELRPSIFDMQEQNEQQQNHGMPQLIRRDSEGYIVREISYEERMQMLNNTYDQYCYQQEEQLMENNDNDYLLDDNHPTDEHYNIPSINEEGNENDSYKFNPSNYFYDSGSEADDDYMDDDDEEDSNYRNEHNYQGDNDQRGNPQWIDVTEDNDFKN